MFYSASVRPGKPAAFVPPPEDAMLHLSQACLPHDAPEGTRASLLVRFEEGEEPAVLCTLCAGRLDTVALDQFVTHYAEFTVAGNATIHLSGYFSPQYGALDGPEEEEDYMHGMHPMLMDADSDEGEEDSDDDEGEDESDDDGAGFGWPAAGRREPSAVIEEIEDDRAERAGKGAAAKKAAAEDSEEEEDDEDEEDDEGESEDDEGEESEEEAPKQKQPQKQQKQPQQQQKQPQDQPKQQQQKQQQQAPQAGDKRKAAQAAAEPASKKTATAAPASTAGKTPAKGAAQQQAAAKTPQAGKQQEQQQTPSSAAAKRVKPRVFENGFEIHDLKMGQPDGRVARPGKRVLMRYIGRLKKNGKVFDQNLKGKPFAFRLGVGEVIKGWDRGVDGMRVGDKRKLVIPPSMAYGTQSLPGIPPNSTLEFEVELVDVKG